MRWQECSKHCAHCGILVERQRGQNLSNFKRDKTCSKECRYALISGSGNGRWIGGVHDDGAGYLRYTKGRKRVHRVVMEQHLGRELEAHEEVHHKDGDKRNNNIKNLELLTKSDHTSITFKGKKRPNSWRIARGLGPI